MDKHDKLECIKCLLGEHCIEAEDELQEKIQEINKILGIIGK
jgi:hypothetical protein